MKIKITDRCVTVGDLRSFLDKLDKRGITDDSVLNPEASKLLAESQRGELSKDLDVLFPATAKALGKLGAPTPVQQASKRIEAALKKGVVLWVEEEI